MSFSRRPKVTKSDIVDQIALNIKNNNLKLEKKYIRLVIDAFLKSLKVIFVRIMLLSLDLLVHLKLEKERDA